MRKWLVFSLALALSWLISTAQPVLAAYTDFQPPFRYSNGDYSLIQDSSGREYQAFGWVCYNNFTQRAVQNSQTGNYECNGQLASYMWANLGSSGEASIVIVDGRIAELDNLKANEGVATASFYSQDSSIRTGQSGYKIVKERVVINNANPDSNFYQGQYISFNKDYKYLDDTYSTIVDTRRNYRYSLYTGNDCPVYETGTLTAGIVNKSNSLCNFNSSTTRAYRFDRGAYSAWIILTSSRNSVELDQGASNALFISLSTDDLKLNDFIDNFSIQSEFYQGDETFETKCNQGIGVLSWILCPMINFAMDKVVSPIQDIILGLLQTDSLLTAPATENNSYYIYNAWRAFLQIANALLAVALLIVIYLMLFTQNTTYSAQRMIPRIVVVVIMMQISYFIAAIMVDIGNVLAAGIANIFDAVRIQAIQAGPNFGSGEFPTVIPRSTEFLTDSAAARGVGAGFGVILATIGLYLWTMFVPGVIFFVAFGAMISVLGVFIALTLRQLAIVALIVLAPVAFVLGMFPQTEKWMKEWFDNLGKLILIYPLMAVVFGVGSLLSYLAIATNQSQVNMIISSAIGLIVLFTIPALFSLAGRLFKRFSAAINGLSGRVKTSAQGDPKDPLSWRSNAAFAKAERQMNARRRFTRAVPQAGRFLKPSFKEAQVYGIGSARMQNVLSGTHPDNLRRIFWGTKPFKSPKGFANWKQSMIDGSADFATQLPLIYRNESMFYDTVNPAIDDTGFLFDKSINYGWGISQLYQSGKINGSMAGGWWQAYVAKVKGRHRMLHAFQPDILMDYEWNDPNHLYSTLFETRLDNIQDQQLRQRVASYRMAAIEDAGNAVSEQTSDGTLMALTTMLADDSFVDYMAQNAKSRDWNGLNHLYLKAQAMADATRDPRTQQAAAQHAATAGDDDDPFRGGYYGAPGHNIRRREEFVAAAQRAYQRAQASGRRFDY